jgi:hypothetical protein
MDPDLLSLYRWVDGFAVSRRKRSFARDFADAVMCVEILEALWPNVVSARAFRCAGRGAGVGACRKKLRRERGTNHAPRPP